MEKIPSILAEHQLAQDVDINVGCNDISSQTSEILKRDLSKLLDSFIVLGKQIFTFLPIPPLIHSMNRFSRILSLHSRLQLAPPCGYECLLLPL